MRVALVACFRHARGMLAARAVACAVLAISVPYLCHICAICVPYLYHTGGIRSRGRYRTRRVGKACARAGPVTHLLGTRLR